MSAATATAKGPSASASGSSTLSDTKAEGASDVLSTLLGPAISNEQKQMLNSYKAFLSSPNETRLHLSGPRRCGKTRFLQAALVASVVENTVGGAVYSFIVPSSRPKHDAASKHWSIDSEGQLVETPCPKGCIYRTTSPVDEARLEIARLCCQSGVRYLVAGELCVALINANGICSLVLVTSVRHSKNVLEMASRVRMAFFDGAEWMPKGIASYTAKGIRVVSTRNN